MDTIRIRPGPVIWGKKYLRTWYVIVLGYKPEGFKDAPYAVIPKDRLPEVINALYKEFVETFH